ncbi:MAG TPA: hypothetical protein DCX28_02880 [Enterobacteriaceae bacterium]|nr:hypothetical protein [Enterobacteriaceae bacterium]
MLTHQSQLVFDEWVFYFHDLHTLLLPQTVGSHKKNRRIIPLFLRCAIGRGLIPINQIENQYIATISESHE